MESNQKTRPSPRNQHWNAEFGKYRTQKAIRRNKILNFEFKQKLWGGEGESSMATTSKNMKGFYRQKKNNSRGGITKSKSSKSTKNPSPKHAGSDITQPLALASPGGSLDLKDDFDEQEEVLRQFDMNMAYGPCLGITRMARWERAQRLGLNPPKEIENLLKGGKVKLESLFDGRV
ncbi:LOW QUALITY PROTEIN: uncharacterized protein LOC110415562 [Herrania umbratica]|uniref:LOW QUALITY PROTEIN: uncharacterized protein LOC110415562 n=1 Tax=Herrania umbratica TaxID=108875 RepID=A0A6J1A7H1_9ROSI|nr:LOW QUALITY PROTEIN: uncharacterized protein LOC110415562 [Herrania umbratica]